MLILLIFVLLVGTKCVNQEGKIINFPETPLIQGGEIEESKQRKIREFKV